ncbi:calcium-binding protein, partial [Thermodesulfobacteriota bacterium]
NGDAVLITSDGYLQNPGSKLNTAKLVGALEASLSTDPVGGRVLLSEFARSRRGMGFHDENCFLSVREHFVLQDPSLGWAFDTGGLPVYDGVGQGLRDWSPHIEGTDNADAVMGSLSEGDLWINGLNGDDVVYGTSHNENLINGVGDAILVAGGGNDTIWAGDGDDILDGGEGNDILYGEAGNDTYILRIGSGHDTIVDSDPTADNTDTIWFGSNLTRGNIAPMRLGNDLILTILASSDTLTVKDYFRNDSTLNQIERIAFMDGTVWTYEEMIAEAYAPTEGDDAIYGTADIDELSGASGNDKLYGLADDDILNGDAGNDYLRGGIGDDTLDAGSGDDELDGGSGNDTYRFDPGSGQDTINDTDTSAGNWDTIEFGPGVLPAEVQLERLGKDLERLIIAGCDCGPGQPTHRLCL